MVWDPGRRGLGLAPGSHQTQRDIRNPTPFVEARTVLAVTGRRARGRRAGVEPEPDAQSQA